MMKKKIAMNKYKNAYNESIDPISYRSFDEFVDDWNETKREAKKDINEL